MTIDIDNVQTFTDAELVVLYRRALAALAISQSTSIAGRTVTRANLPEIRKQIEWLEGRSARAAAGGSLIALGRIHRAR